MRLQHIALTTLIAASAASAADGAQISDLRLGFYGMGASASADYELTGALSDSGTQTYDADSHGRFTVSYVAGEAKPAGVIFGVGLAFDAADYAWEDGSDADQTWSGMIVDFNLGMAIALNESIHFEAAGVLGFGAGTVEIDMPGATIDPADATIVEYGLRFGAYATLGALQVGLETGWMSTSYLGAEWSVVGVAPGDLTYSEDTEFSGTFIGLTLGARL